MVKLDSIFKALGIETENDVRLLAQYFINHRQYKELLKTKSKMTDDGSNGEDGKDDSVELIHPIEVLTAIKTFLSFHRKQEGFVYYFFPIILSVMFSKLLFLKKTKSI